MEKTPHEHEYLYFDIRDMGREDRDYKELFDEVRIFLRNHRGHEFSRHNPTIEALHHIIAEAERKPYCAKSHKLALLAKKTLGSVEGYEVEDFEIKLKV